MKLNNQLIFFFLFKKDRDLPSRLFNAKSRISNAFSVFSTRNSYGENTSLLLVSNLAKGFLTLKIYYKRTNNDILFLNEFNKSLNDSSFVFISTIEIFIEFNNLNNR